MDANQEHYAEEPFEDEELHEGIDGVAIIGMSVRLPGAENLEEYWRNLRDGVESIRTFSDGELLAAGVDPSQLDDPSYVKARGVLDEIERFDAQFFGFTPREAETMDPQHRIFLEESWRALEHAGYDPASLEGAAGVFAGSNLTGYLLHNLAPNDDLVKRVGPLQIRIRNDKDFLSTLVAYKLDLKGSAVNVQTACSSSLVSVSLACQSLLSYQNDLALAGGVSVTVPNPSGYLYQEGVYAPDGHCRAFDIDARGTVLGDGVAIVVLKRLEDALADGDTVHAVIRGFATNNDGSLKLDYTAPSVDGQAEVIGMAHALGELEAESISYVEAHGTGTPLGDPVEVAALTQAFRASTEATNFCGIGSVKTNIGHLDAAAGTASLVKAVLALEHEELPPTLHFNAPNPQLGLEGSPFRVVSELEPWQRREDGPRRAGVSSFGVGGTNAHVVVEEAPACEPSGPSRPWQLLVLSARSNDSLDAMSENLADHLEQHRPPLADVAHTLARGRRGFDHRRAVVCRDRADAVKLLRGEEPRRLISAHVRPEAERRVSFMFSGVGDQYVGMGRELYENEAVFRQTIDQGAKILEPILGFDPREILYPEAADTAAEKGSDEPGKDDLGRGPDLRAMLGRSQKAEDPNAERLARTEVLHPVLFLLEVALAKQWMAWGIEPESMIGYSIGEYVAACLAGVFSFEDGLALVARRARIIEEQPEGAMLAVSLPEQEVRALLAEPDHAGLDLAAVNGRSFCVVAGDVEGVERLAGSLEGREIVHRRLQARHPFHSRRLEVAMDDFLASFEGVELAPPRIPILANLTGTWMRDEEATDPRYWAEHMCRTVRFGDGVEVLLEQDRILLELGPGQNLTSIVMQSAGRSAVAVPTLPHGYDAQPAQAFALHSLGRLWSVGVAVDWAAFFEGEERRRVPLPTYVFDRRRYWVEPVERSAREKKVTLDKLHDPAQWLYRPVWKEAGPLVTTPETVDRDRWLILAEQGDDALADALVSGLETAGAEVVVVERASGEGFAELGEGRYALDPGRSESFATLFRALEAADRLPRHLAYLWSTVGSGELEDRCFFDLLRLAQGWGEVMGAGDHELSLHVVSSAAFEVAGESEIVPEKALLAGPCRVIPQEYPRLECRQIDLPGTVTAEGGSARRWGLPLVAELLAGEGRAVALRGRRRWMLEYDPMPLPTSDGEMTRLRQEGVYVITGGLGGIGLTLAGHLAENFRARLVLVGRRELPERAEWTRYQAETAPTDPVHRTIQRLEALEEVGAEVLVARADVTRRDQLEAARRAAVERFGTIHGVIHAAGQAPGGLIQLKTAENAAAVLAPKVLGTRIVDEVFGGGEPESGEALDFLLLCSSLTALTGTVGLVDHVAANAFLDAWAQRSAGRRALGQAATRTVAVNWDSWLEVGQAAEAGVASRLEALLGGEDVVETTSHYPRWEHRTTEEDGEEIFLSRLSAAHWVVAEHRFQGVGLLPGTAYLEMARRAARELLEDEHCSLEKVIFSQPCRVPTGEEVLLRIRLGHETNGYHFTIDSRPGGGGPWSEHARGRIVSQGLDEVGARHDFEAVSVRCQEASADEALDPERSKVDFGGRWRDLLQELRVGENEGWARLELPADYRGDLDDFAFHPALADAASGIVRVLGSGAYLPLSYESVAIHGRLPAALQCHFRRSGSAADEGEILTSDVVVGDLEGNTLIEIRGYALRHLDAASIPRATPPPQPFARVESGRAKQSSFGLLPREGAEVFGRLMTGALDEPQVVVSVRDFSAVLGEIERLTGDRAAEHMALLGAGGERSGAHAPYEAPRTDLETLLARLFQDMLGEERVGIHDNFFDLGGNSLVATQLITRLREELDVEITLRALFEAPTVAELAVAVVEEQATDVEDDELAAALDELSGLSREELLEQLAEADAPLGADV